MSCAFGKLALNPDLSTVLCTPRSDGNLIRRRPKVDGHIQRHTSQSIQLSSTNRLPGAFAARGFLKGGTAPSLNGISVKKAHTTTIHISDRHPAVIPNSSRFHSDVQGVLLSLLSGCSAPDLRKCPSIRVTKVFLEPRVCTVLIVGLHLYSLDNVGGGEGCVRSFLVSVLYYGVVLPPFLHI